MKKLFAIFLLLPAFVFCQDAMLLSADHYIDLSTSKNKIFEIVKLKNFELYKNMNIDSAKRLNQKENALYFRKLYALDVVKLNPGKYQIKNDKSEVYFTINDKGLLNGELIYLAKGKSYEHKMIFENGIAVIDNILNRVTADTITRSFQNDGIYTEINYDKNGKMNYKRTTDFNLPGDDEQGKQVTVRYYENEKVSMEQNNIAKTFKTFNEKGKLTRYTNDIMEEGAYYTDDGVLERKYYKDEKGKWSETYDKGKIDSKKLIGDTEYREYFYTNGKLDYYEIYNKKSEETKVFDAKNKLIPGKKIPRVQISN